MMKLITHGRRRHSKFYNNYAISYFVGCGALFTAGNKVVLQKIKNLRNRSDHIALDICWIIHEMTNIDNSPPCKYHRALSQLACGINQPNVALKPKIKIDD